MCLPTAPALPPIDNGDFGVSPFCGQLSDKSQLAFAFHMGVRGMKRNSDGKIKHRALSYRPADCFSNSGE
jgi:hypothetical protein